jgi:hypothetical protein
MLGRAQNGETLTITSIVVGDGFATQPSDLWPLTALNSQQFAVVISTKNDYGNGTLLVEGSFTSDEVAAAFYLRELGVMAHIGSEADRLYSVANVFSDPPDYIDPAAPTVQAFKIKLVIDRIPTAQVVVQIGPSENVIGSNIGAETVGPGVYHDAAGNVLNFKRLVQGIGMDIRDATDGNSIYIGIKTLAQNVDLYVPMNNPDAPAGHPEVLFPSVQAAHDYLLGSVIPPSLFATIHVHELNNAPLVSAPIVLSHPNSKQINIIGVPLVDRAITSIVPVSGGKEIHCDSTGLGPSDVGRYVYITNSYRYGGGCWITLYRANDIVCNIYDQGGLPAESVTETPGSQRLRWLPTALRINANPTTLSYMIAAPNGIGTIRNILVIGDSRAQAPNNDTNQYFTYGFGIDSGALINCMAVNCRRGVSVGSGNVGLGNECIFSNCAFGITGVGTLVATDQTYVNGCLQGITPSPSGFAVGSVTGNMPNAIVFLLRNYYGLLCGAFYQGGSVFYGRNVEGFECRNNGLILLGAAYGSYPYNNGIDLKAIGHSYITYDQWGQAVPTCSPLANAFNPAPPSCNNALSFITLANSSGRSIEGVEAGEAGLFAKILDSLRA